MPLRVKPLRVMLIALFLSAGALCASFAANAQEAADPQMPDILPLEKRAAVEDAWLKERLDTVVGPLMRREGVDMWILIAGEYNEDPVARTMLPATWLSARRTTILVFFDRGAENGEEGGVERLAVARYPVTDLFPSEWDPEAQPDQWARLAEIVRERNPRAIAVNMSETFPLADGLSHAMHGKLEAALGADAAKLTASHGLALGWLETRIAPEMAVYPMVVRIAHAIMAEALSEKVVTPGVTTADDVRWWLRERVAELKLDVWFHPSVNIQRPDQETFDIAAMGLARDNVIQPGDFLHMDFGITYLGLNTDTQHHAYVLKPGETEAPKGLRDGLAAANRVQDALKREFKAGRTGNEVLAAARKRALAARLNPTIYTHPIGYHGHGAGPWIGMWDNQGPVPVRGEYAVHPNTAWSN